MTSDEMNDEEVQKEGEECLSRANAPITPGPWKLKLDPYPNGAPHCCIELPNVGDEYRGFVSGVVGNADARMIAAASEMYEALRKIGGGHVPPGFLNGIESESPADFRGRMWTWSQQVAQAAIAKAEGKS